MERNEDARRLTVMSRRSGRLTARLCICRGARFPAIVGVWLLVVALPLAACSSVAPASSTPGFVGYEWQVVTVSHNGTARSIPASLQVFLRFSPNGRFGANDGVNFRSGVYRTTGDSFTVGGMSATSAGYAGHDPTVLLAINAIGSFDDGVHATAKLTGDRLVVGVDAYTLTCQRRGRQADRPTAAGTAG